MFLYISYGCRHAYIFLDIIYVSQHVCIYIHTHLQSRSLQKAAEDPAAPTQWPVANPQVVTPICTIMYTHTHKTHTPTPTHKTHTHTHTHISTHTYPYTHIYMYICIYMHMCIYIYINSYMCIYIFIYICIRIYIHMYTCIARYTTVLRNSKTGI